MVALSNGSHDQEHSSTCHSQTSEDEEEDFSTARNQIPTIKPRPFVAV